MDCRLHDPHMLPLLADAAYRHTPVPASNPVSIAVQRLVCGMLSYIPLHLPVRLSVQQSGLSRAPQCWESTSASLSEAASRREVAY